MKKALVLNYLIFIYFLLSVGLPAQTLKMGMGLDSKVHSNDLHFQFGPDIYLEYYFYNSPLSI